MSAHLENHSALLYVPMLLLLIHLLVQFLLITAFSKQLITLKINYIESLSYNLCKKEKKPLCLI